MKSGKQQTNFKDLESDANKLYVSKQNPNRLKEIIKKINFYYYVIK